MRIPGDLLLFSPISRYRSKLAALPIALISPMLFNKWPSGWLLPPQARVSLNQSFLFREEKICWSPDQVSLAFPWTVAW